MLTDVDVLILLVFFCVFTEDDLGNDIGRLVNIVIKCAVVVVLTGIIRWWYG